MGEKAYRISLTVPLGNRDGTLIFHENDGKVDGWLNILKEKNRCFGALSEEGRLTLTGNIRTLVSTMSYRATGMISGRKLLLNLKMDSGAYYPVFGEEFDLDDKVL